MVAISYKFFALFTALTAAVASPSTDTSPVFPSQGDLDKFCVAQAKEHSVPNPDEYVWSALRGHCVKPEADLEHKCEQMIHQGLAAYRKYSSSASQQEGTRMWSQGVYSGQDSVPRFAVMDSCPEGKATCNRICGTLCGPLEPGCNWAKTGCYISCAIRCG